MTSVVLSVALLLTPSPLTAPKETPHWPQLQPTVSTVESAHPTSPWPPEIRVEVESLFAPIESLAPSVEPPPQILTPTPMELVDQIFGWPGAQLVTCESNWNRWAVGRFGERGLFQIHPIHRYGIVARLGYSFDDMFEVEPNIRVAAEIRRTQGLSAWTCWKG